MKVIDLIFLVFLAWFTPRLAEAADNFPASRYPFDGVLDVSDIPQFVTITFSGGLSPERVDSIREHVMSLTDARGCAPTFTSFISFDYDQSCDLVWGLFKGGNELASHTFDFTYLPSSEDIEEGIDYLHNNCGIPLEEIRGFRTPYLDYDQTTLDHIYDLDILYDSSIVADDNAESEFGRKNYWPFTMDDPSVLDISCNCDKSKSLPGLWEIPMYRLFDTTSDEPLESISSYANIDVHLQPNFERRYNGNRAPFGIYFDSLTDSDGTFIASWIETINNNYPDVFFVTYYELIEWMRNPVSVGEYQQKTCEDQVVDCFPTGATYTCSYGESFDRDTCACDCSPGFCRTDEGTCTSIGCEATDDPCCSEDYRTCILFCGTTEAECMACGDYVWLEDGSLGDTCGGRWQSCSADENSCCPGLDCVWADEWTASCQPIEEPSSSPTTTASSPPPTTTARPSPSPTETPLEPSLTPSLSPSVSPTTTVQPSQSPTETPQPSQSMQPSLSPSESPSEGPTGGPSSLPSATPTISKSPSLEPSLSAQPSQSPSWTVAPSATPSMSPSAEPSASPSVVSSETPSVSMSPSEEPSLSPSVSFSPTIIAQPSVSPQPSQMSTEQPSSTPSLTPTASQAPSSSPSSSVQPSASASPTVTEGLYYGVCGEENVCESVDGVPTKYYVQRNRKFFFFFKRCKTFCVAEDNVLSRIEKKRWSCGTCGSKNRNEAFSATFNIEELLQSDPADDSTSNLRGAKQQQHSNIFAHTG